MQKRTVEMKPDARAAMKASGMTDTMIDDVTKQIDDGLAFATTRIAELDAQIAQLENDRAFWNEKREGYQASLDASHIVTVEEVSDVEPGSGEAAKAKAESDGDKT